MVSLGTLSAPFNQFVVLVFLFLLGELSGKKIINAMFADSVRSQIYVIITTFHPQYAAEAYEHKGLGFLSKPISNQRFLNAIEDALE